MYSLWNSGKHLATKDSSGSRSACGEGDLLVATNRGYLHYRRGVDSYNGSEHALIHFERNLRGRTGHHGCELRCSTDRLRGLCQSKGSYENSCA